MKAVYCLPLLVALLAKSLAVSDRPSSLKNDYFEREAPSVDPNAEIHPRRSKRNAYKFDEYQWPNATVPYAVDARFNDKQRQTIASAINEYHTKTCVRFVNRQPSDVDYLQIILDDTVCGDSAFCRQGGAQFSKIGSSCIAPGIETVTHELGHVLCFSHEWERSDRDDYVSFNTSICQPSPKKSVTEFTNLDLLYDYLSVHEHEPPYVSGCMVPKLKGVTKFSSGGPLSVLDAEKVNAYYRCGGCFSYRFRPLSLIRQNNVLFAGGVDTNGAIMYPCRGYLNGDILVGKAIPAAKACWVTYNGAEYTLTGKIEILTNPQNANLNWRKRPVCGSVPTNAIPGGRTATRDTLYIGRFSKVFNGKSTTIIGKVFNKICYAGYGGLEYSTDDFDYLVCN